MLHCPLTLGRGSAITNPSLFWQQPPSVSSLLLPLLVVLLGYYLLLDLPH